MTTPRRSIAIGTLAAALTLSACGGNDRETGADEDDVHFAQAMIAHHEQAIEMSEIALDPTVGAGAPVVALATAIRDAQDAEIDVMTAWLEARDEPLVMDESDGHDMSEAGMMTPEDMNDLGAAAGPDFDRTWLEMMIAHHRGAISMAEEVRAEGIDPAVAQLAETIVAAQTAEIEQMEALLG